MTNVTVAVNSEDIPLLPWDTTHMNEKSFPMRETDIPRVLEIERLCFPVPWSHRSFLAELFNPDALSIVTTQGDPPSNDSLEKSTIQAYSCNRVIGDELSILRMAVAPGTRRLGLASRLLDIVLSLSGSKGAAQAYLEVRPSNIPAISLYQKKGFQIIGTRPGYYPETGEDALIMKTTIKEIS
jgi:ribosomal-protein-alanine N-acetyltransferase